MNGNRGVGALVREVALAHGKSEADASNTLAASLRACSTSRASISRISSTRRQYLRA